MLFGEEPYAGNLAGKVEALERELFRQSADSQHDEELGIAAREETEGLDLEL